MIPLVADMASKSDVARLVREIESREKCLCILINNAGIFSHTQPTEIKTAEEMKKNLFETTMQYSTTGQTPTAQTSLNASS